MELLKSRTSGEACIWTHTSPQKREPVISQSVVMLILPEEGRNLKLFPDNFIRGDKKLKIIPTCKIQKLYVTVQETR